MPRRRNGSRGQVVRITAPTSPGSSGRDVAAPQRAVTTRATAWVPRPSDLSRSSSLPGAAPPSRGRPRGHGRRDRPARHVGCCRPPRAPDLILGGPQSVGCGGIGGGARRGAGRRSGPGRSTLGAMTPAPVDLSVVVPMYNEEAVLPLLVERLRPVADGVGRAVRDPLRRRRVHRRHPGAAAAAAPRVAAGARRPAAGERRAPGRHLGRPGPRPRAAGSSPSTPTCRTRPR